jgi:hypothetical protein
MGGGRRVVGTDALALTPAASAEVEDVIARIGREEVGSDSVDVDDNTPACNDDGEDETASHRAKDSGKWGANAAADVFMVEWDCSRQYY